MSETRNAKRRAALSDLARRNTVTIPQVSAEVRIDNPRVPVHTLIMS